MNILPPTSEAELLNRAYTLAGKTLGDIAKLNQKHVPLSLIHAKGWIGQLIEKTLGANGSNLDQPDFINLGIELKTLPVTNQGFPCESTFICAASIPCMESKWEDSRVWRKMAKILWVPIESNSEIPLMAQRIGTPILWSPSQKIELQLKQDWEELTELMTLGKFDELSALKGQYLQIRPKAANAKTFIQVIDNQGQQISIVPKGFYIRTLLTRQILEHHYST
jgi:DNA mismatch repair protein MutH